MNSKKLNEMSAASGAVAGAVKSAAIYDPAGKKANKNAPKKGFKIAKLREKKSEETLREAIRNLIFLNKVKYHEEAVKKELQEQKIRRIIRTLLKEADNSRNINFETTGAASAWTFIEKVETTTFQNDFAEGLISSNEQRETFKAIYLAGIKVYLDSLDQQTMIMHPEEGGQPPQQAPAAAPPPAKRRDLKEQEDMDAVHPTAAPGVKPSTEPINTKGIQSQAVQSAVLAAKGQYKDRTGHDRAINALNRDLPQIDPLYFNLTFKPITTKSGRTTSDRQEFRFFLIGDQDKVGNLQLIFKQYNDANPIAGQEQASNVPKLEPDPLTPPSISGGTPPSPAPEAGPAPATGPVPAV